MAQDDPIDRLYQLPLDEFTPARNALAKDAGKGAPEIKRLEKPNAAAWAVNQLYWRERELYDSLIAASEKLRAAYRQQLAGKSSDVKAAETAHRELVKKATQAAREILEAAGNASGPVMDAIRETLDTLPGADRPGRLTRPLKRTGFEALQGFSVSATPKPITPQSRAGSTGSTGSSGSTPTAKERKATAAEERERKMTTERLRFAEAAEREAEAALERTRRAVERAERVRQRIEGDLADAAEAEKKLRREETTRVSAYEKAVADRERLSKTLS